VGSRPVHAHIGYEGLRRNPHRDALGDQNAAKNISSRIVDSRPTANARRWMNSANKPTMSATPTKAQLFGNHANRKSVCASGQIKKFFSTLAPSRHRSIHHVQNAINECELIALP
jgi:hypothetical protein